MNSSGRGCGNPGRMCPASPSSMDEFALGINATSSPVSSYDTDDSYSLPRPPARGTRVIKRTKVTRTSSDADDSHLQNNTFGMESSDRSHKSHGSSGPDTYHTFQGYNEPSVVQQTLPLMARRNPQGGRYNGNRTAPALIRTDRGPPTPSNSLSYPFPSSPIESPCSFERGPLGYDVKMGSDNRPYNANRISPRTADSTGYSQNYQFGVDSAPAAYGRSFDPARVVIDPRTDNQTCPGRVNASLTSRSGRSAYGNQSAPPAYGRSFDPGRVVIDPRMDNQTAPGALDRSGRGVCQNQTCNSSAASSSWSPPVGSTPFSGKRPPRTPPHNMVQGGYSYSSSEPSYQTSEGSNSGKSYGSSFPFSPQQAGHLTGFTNTNSSCPASMTSAWGGTYNASGASFNPPRPPVRRRLFATDVASDHGANQNTSDDCGVYPLSPPNRSHSQPPPKSKDYLAMIEHGQLTPTSKKKKTVHKTTSSGSVVSEECEEVYDIPETGHGTDMSAKNVINSFPTYYVEPSPLHPPIQHPPESGNVSSLGLLNASCFNTTPPADYISKQSHSSRNEDHSSLGILNPSYYDGTPTSGLLSSQSPCRRGATRCGIVPAQPGMPHYVGRRNRPAPGGNNSSTMNESDFNSSDSFGHSRGGLISSTMNESDFNTMASCGSSRRGNISSTMNESDFNTSESFGSSRRGPCSCKKKAARKGSPKDGSKCESIGTPCREKKSHSSNRSGGGSPDIARADDPVNVFQADKYDISAETNATHSVTPAADSRSCICISGNISLDLERIEQEEYAQLTRNLSQWQQSRRKVVSKIESFSGSKANPGSCPADCAVPNEH